MRKKALLFPTIAVLAFMAAAPLGIHRPSAIPQRVLALDGSDVVWTIEVDPPEPTVGDSVVLTVVASGIGFIPAYYLSVAPEGESAPLSVDSGPEGEWPSPSLGFPAVWHLTAVRKGEATLSIAVEYDKPFCEGDPPRCSTYFVWVHAEPVVIQVAGEPPVGGAGVFPDVGGSSGGGAASLARVLVPSATAGLLVLAGAAWYARRRWAG